jgi:hypothetical protein
MSTPFFRGNADSREPAPKESVGLGFSSAVKEFFEE